MQEPEPRKARIELPSSGLAEEILGKLEPPAEAGTGEAAERPAAEDAYGEDGPAAEEALHLVTFYLNAEEYALDISQVREIIRVSGWTRVPNSPAHIKGVINLRGRIIPVMDPKVKMGLEETPQTRNARVMVVDAGNRTVGVLVDMVHQVLRLPLSVVEPPPEEVSRADEGYIRGVGKMGGRLVILLDLESITGNGARPHAAA